MKITLPDNSKLAFTWVRKGVLCLEILIPGHFGNPGIHLLRTSKLIDGEELKALFSMLQDGGEREIPLPPAA